MPTQFLTEGIVDKTLQYLKDNLEGQLAAIAADYPDDIDLPAPTAWFVGERRLNDRLGEASVFVFGESMRVLRYNASFTDADHRVAVRIALRGAETERLQRQMYRYVRAVWELLVGRFFGEVDESDYYTLGEDIDVEYDRDPSGGTTETNGLTFVRATISFTANKQEEW